MKVAEPKYRRPISANQEQLLRLLYKFRFVSSDLLAEVLAKNRSTIYESLYVLGKQGYVHKIYKRSYRIRQLPARYTLAPNGIRHLLAQGYCNAATLRYFFRNRSAKPWSIEHSLDVMKVFSIIKQQTKKAFTVYSGPEIAEDPDYLRPLPDLCLERNRKHPNKPELYLLEVLDKDKPFWKHTQRLSAHQKHYDVNWEYKNYPTILLVAPDYRTERYMLKVVENRWFDFDVWVTNKKMLQESQDGKVWATDFDEDEELVRL